jgi:hypothetical protein
MRCSACAAEGVTYVTGAYVVYSEVSADGTSTVGAPYVQTFDDSFVECRDCGWKDDDSAEVRLVDTHVEDDLR